MNEIAITFGVLGLVLTLPGTLELFLVTVSSLFPGKQQNLLKSTILKIAVLVPAHNEEFYIRRVVRSILDCDYCNNEVSIIVIADNCSDNTAHLAHLAGVNVLQRNDLQNRGKGQALHFAFQVLLPENFDLFIIVDADSVVEKNFISEFALHFQEGADAAQCRYLVKNTGVSKGTRLMNLALMAMHVVRPKGRRGLNLSCGIFGNGFALTTQTLKDVPYLAHSITEDLEYHLALLKAGKKVTFVDNTTVRADFPESVRDMTSQRERWEGGRLRMVLEKTPFLVGEIFKGNLRMIEPLLELLTFPLSFHVMLLLFTLLIPFSFIQLYAAGALGIVILHIFTGVLMAGGKEDLLAFLSIPFYMVWKVLRLRGILKTSGKTADWVRTIRGNQTK